MRSYLICLTLLLASIVVYGQGHIEKNYLIFPFQSQHVHSSSLVSLPNGDLLSVWFQGSGERKSDDVALFGARLKKGATSWSAPFLMADTPGLPDCNPILFLNHKKKLFLVWVAVQANRWEFSILKFKTSVNYNEDGAPLWEWQDNILLKPNDNFADITKEKFSELPENNSGWAEYAPLYDDMIIEASKDAKKRSIGWMTRIKPLLINNNKIVLPLYSDGFNFSLMALSDDDGETWHPGNPLVGRGPIQPALALKKDGSITAMLRDSGDPPNRVHISYSQDNGMNWSASEKTNFPNTASVELLVLKDGRWLLVANDVEYSRHKISMYISENEGKDWKLHSNLENNPEGSFSYPSIIQAENGLIHCSYSYHLKNGTKTIKHVVINPNLL
ncbi:MAG: exo-alpha-sialidase [Cyclobacteriaceae bacterium]|nr:exo-alpha-sialidase [Cyclobacteriaceae bacterium]